MAEEWAEDGHKQWKDEEEQRIAAVGTLLVVEQRVKDHNTKLTEVGREKKSVKAKLAGPIAAQNQRPSRYCQGVDRGSEEEVGECRGGC